MCHNWGRIDDWSAAVRLIGLNQGGHTQAFKYDAEGRLLYERIPELVATLFGGIDGERLARLHLHRRGAMENKWMRAGQSLFQSTETAELKAIWRSSVQKR